MKGFATPSRAFSESSLAGCPSRAGIGCRVSLVCCFQADQHVVLAEIPVIGLQHVFHRDDKLR